MLFRATERKRNMNWAGCEQVEIVPGKVSGAPILKNSRVTADAILESYDLGESVEQIAFSFGIEPVQIRQVLRFAL